MSLRTGAVLLVVGVVGALGIAAPTAIALRDPYGGAGDDDLRAVELLRWSADAMRSTSYSGTRMLSAWGHDNATTVVVDVDHVAGQGTRLSMRGGGISEDTAMFLASGGGSEQVHNLGVRSFDLLTDAYAVTLGGSDSVAGRRSTVVQVSRGGTLAGRLWVDDRSGLLLRREVFDSHGRLVRESAFIDVDVATRGFMGHLPPTAPEPVGHGVGLGNRTALEGRGWDCPREAGAMRLVGIEVLNRTGAVHMTYSDGLTRMSVFEQRGRLDPDAVRGFDRVRMGADVLYVREGMPTYAMWESEGLVFTAVTDGPLESVTAVVASESAAGGDDGRGFWERVAGGMTRLGAWATPLL